MQLVIVSGRSGSGKSTALAVLEDNNFYCIDNLPAELLLNLVENTLLANDPATQQVAVSIDARNLPHQLEQLPQLLAQIKQLNIDCDVLYLDASNASLLKRFSETRRRHPLTKGSLSLAEAIEAEKQMLAPIAQLADLTIDTTQLNLYQLADCIKLRLLDKPEPTTSILLESFGFKRGLPIDADLVFDVRCLPNPYWEPELRAYSGQDSPVQEYFAQQPEVGEMYTDLYAYLSKWLPRIADSNRAYVTVAIGCTGGRHRSVYLVDQLAKALDGKLPNLQIRHRDLHAKH
ncbi:glmZ(sRNA)-inactivating NTPase [Thiopseudomonas alkaliphila]|uniref:RNase adapter RapZ n=1 Tax=Thiopseudomonas alkaliphila TaxID=1697053 RepID=UPI00069E5224|nr:RNase adapter RapZ [Thiopseudomonas alkaliphila]AKX56007.1 glmZ(sRNA)-inactivating NTPase [Thiopseudomonas alkaliphila]